MVRYQTRIKYNLFLQIINACNIQNFDQRKIRKSLTNELDTGTQIKINYTCKSRNTSNRITLNNKINPLKIETQCNFIK